MRSAVDRRQLVLEYVSDHRFATIDELASEFSVNRRTIERDIRFLSCSYPIVTENWRGGGVRALDGWYLTHRYLHDDQEALLRSLLPRLAPEDKIKMEQILTAFAKPKKEDKQ